MKEMIPLSLRQRKAFVWWARREYEDYAAIICDGAIRSGKTLAMGMGFFFWAMACFSDRQFALCGRSVGALRRYSQSNTRTWSTTNVSPTAARASSVAERCFQR